MKLNEVPAPCLALQCGVCLDYLAVPPGQTVAERNQMVEDHHALCPARPRDGR